MFFLELCIPGTLLATNVAHIGDKVRETNKKLFLPHKVIEFDQILFQIPLTFSYSLPSVGEFLNL